MLKNRVIPTLLLSHGRLVKTVNFANPNYVGDPLNAVRIFNEKEVDELIVIDIEAGKNACLIDYNLIEKIAGECFMPLSYGGGIDSLEVAERIISLGAEKICVQSSAVNNPNFITELAERFGRSSVIFSLDLKRNWLGQPKVYVKKSNFKVKDYWIELLKTLVDYGAGEVLLNSVDRDGTLSGPDLDLISLASEAIDVPLIALGGIASLSDIKNAVRAGASAVAAGSFFVYYGKQRAVLISYPKYEELECVLNE